MKSINTLVEDIYTTLASGKAKIDSTNLAKVLGDRIQNSQRSGDALRMSNLGEKCERKLWYRANKPEAAEPLDGRSLLNFLNGDIAEETVLSIVEQSGHEAVGRQEEVELYGVKGHIDAIIDGVVVDVKSANSRSIEKFKEHKLESDDPFGYLSQLDAYAAALEHDSRVKIKGEFAFLAYNKENGSVVLDKYKRIKIDWKTKISSLRGMLAEAVAPKRAYLPEPDGKSGNMQLPMPCRYCQFKRECYSNANGGTGLREFLYSYGSKFLIHVGKEPNVQEVQGKIQDTKLGKETT